MDPYYFETDKFGLSTDGIHLLRSRYNYKTIEFNSIEEIYIERGRQIKNWLLALIIGIALLIAGVYAGWNVLYDYFWGTRYRFYIEEFVVPVLPLFVGVYFIYISMKKGLVMKVISEHKILKLPLGDLNKKPRINELLDFLQTNSLTKHKIRAN